MTKQPLTVFLHVPKTGGTTMNNIFRNQYSTGELFDHDRIDGKGKLIDTISPVEKEKIKAVSGHYFYGFHQHFSMDYTYFTLLREPVDRVLSSYYFLRDFPGHEHIRSLTLEEFVKTKHVAHNLQTAMISGIGRTPKLDKALDHLSEFKVVGLTEKFDDSLFLLQKAYGWKHVQYKKQNITKKRPLKEDVPERIIKLIEKYNTLDMKLYLYGKTRLNNEISLLSPNEKNSLETFKKNIRTP
ncbi:sulfotransferase family protein [Bacillus sp. BHET2]|uniref:sulfotransferase family 2 domain-containing protein n=1 Tax=Bacillus sp. BHET2 TaxID=2583818 RepID=UPI00110ECFBE|nr:sulfotransferase family 2 domain-containing protein [Bacillus sp. BHET2]TMU87703.1 sulfotransferase family protein [Bacillus sp. BHET2]